jgi:hypothetical protein
MYAHSGILTKHRQFFPEIDLIAQPAYRTVAVPDLPCLGRREEPPRKRLFPDTGASRRQKLKQARVAEQIEISGVHVVRIAEAFPSLSAPSPTIFNPG